MLVLIGMFAVELKDVRDSGAASTLGDYGIKNEDGMHKNPSWIHYVRRPDYYPKITTTCTQEELNKAKARLRSDLTAPPTKEKKGCLVS